MPVRIGAKPPATTQRASAPKTTTLSKEVATKKAQQIVQRYLDSCQVPGSGTKVKLSSFSITVDPTLPKNLVRFNCTAQVLDKNSRPGDFNIFGPHGVVDLKTGKIAVNPQTKDDWFEDGRWT